VVSSKNKKTPTRKVSHPSFRAFDEKVHIVETKRSPRKALKQGCKERARRCDGLGKSSKERGKKTAANLDRGEGEWFGEKINRDKHKDRGGEVPSS